MHSHQLSVTQPTEQKRNIFGVMPEDIFPPISWFLPFHIQISVLSRVSRSWHKLIRHQMCIEVANLIALHPQKEMVMRHLLKNPQTQQLLLTGLFLQSIPERFSNPALTTTPVIYDGLRQDFPIFIRNFINTPSAYTILSQELFRRVELNQFNLNDLKNRARVMLLNGIFLSEKADTFILNFFDPGPATPETIQLYQSRLTTLLKHVFPALISLSIPGSEHRCNLLTYCYYQNKFTAFCDVLASSHGQYAISRYVSVDNERYPLQHLAVKHGRLPELKAILDTYPTVINAIDQPNRWTLLHTAARNNLIAIATDLLTRPHLDMTILDADRNSAIMIAAIYSMDIMLLLLNKGAGLTPINQHPNILFWFMSRFPKARPETIKAILTTRDAKQLLTAINAQGQQILHLSVVKSLLDYIETLATNGADINATTPEQDTALLLATKQNDFAIMKFLLTLPMLKPHLCDNAGLAAIHYIADRLAVAYDRQAPFDRNIFGVLLNHLCSVSTPIVTQTINTSEEKAAQSDVIITINDRLDEKHDNTQSNINQPQNALSATQTFSDQFIQQLIIRMLKFASIQQLSTLFAYLRTNTSSQNWLTVLTHESAQLPDEHESKLKLQQLTQLIDKLAAINSAKWPVTRYQILSILGINSPGLILLLSCLLYSTINRQWDNTSLGLFLSGALYVLFMNVCAMCTQSERSVHELSSQTQSTISDYLPTLEIQYTRQPLSGVIDSLKKIRSPLPRQIELKAILETTLAPIRIASVSNVQPALFTHAHTANDKSVPAVVQANGYQRLAGGPSSI